MFATAIVVVVIFVVFSKGRVTTTNLAIGKIPPNISLKDLSGNNVVIPADLKGKVTLIHFWVSSCSYCVTEMCTLESYYRKHHDKGIIAFSINAGEDRKSAIRYISKLKISYPILLDHDLSVTKQYGVVGVPTTYILDREGVLRFKFAGEISAFKLDEAVKTLL